MQLVEKAKCKVISSDPKASLSSAISQLLDLRLCSITSSTFSNKETRIVLNESVRGTNVFIIQNQRKPANDRIMETLAVIQTCTLCSAERITAILPCMPYTSLHHSLKTPVNLQLIVNLLRKAGANQIITLEMDIFNSQYQLNLPVENLKITDEFCSWFRNKCSDLSEICFVGLGNTAPDRVRNLAKSLGCDFRVLPTKFVDRESELSDDPTEEMQLVECIDGKTVVLFEGVADDCLCLCTAAKSISEMGAKTIYAVCIHGAFTEDGLCRLSDSPISIIVTTNSIDQSESLRKCAKIQCLDVSSHFASAIARIHNSTMAEEAVAGCDDATPVNGDIVT